MRIEKIGKVLLKIKWDTLLEFQVTSGWYSPGSHWAHWPPLTVRYPSPGVFSSTWRVLLIRMKRNIPIEMIKRTPFTKATFEQTVRQFQRTVGHQKCYSFRLVKQNVNAQLHYNLNQPQTDCAQNPYGGIWVKDAAKCKMQWTHRDFSMNPWVENLYISSVLNTTRKMV